MKPGGSTFNIQNFIPHKSKKPKATPETNRPKAFQRGTAKVTESAKECSRGLTEGSDIGLGALQSHSCLIPLFRDQLHNFKDPDRTVLGFRKEVGHIFVCSDFFAQLLDDLLIHAILAQGF